jgi:hypothetical protein
LLRAQSGLEQETPASTSRISIRYTEKGWAVGGNHGLKTGHPFTSPELLLD